jgi:ClpP class serine protease
MRNLRIAIHDGDFQEFYSTYRYLHPKDRASIHKTIQEVYDVESKKVKERRRKGK